MLAIVTVHCSDQRFYSISDRDVPDVPDATNKFGKHCQNVPFQAGLTAIDVTELFVCPRCLMCIACKTSFTCYALIARSV